MAWLGRAARTVCGAGPAVIPASGALVAAARPRWPAATSGVRCQSTEAALDGRGWVPSEPVTTTALDELEGVLWTPTGTGGYPADWEELNAVPWAPGLLRTGAIALKLGMTHTFDTWGAKVPLTALQFIDNQVVEVRTQQQHGVDALVIGAVNHPRDYKLRPSLRNMFASKGLPAKRHLKQFKVAPEAALAVGDAVNVDHFVPGQYVDVISTTIGKGFAGVMKRHNMAGGNASHGATKMHRKMGASGGGQDPGRIWKGKRMAGRMGGAKVITHSQQAFKIDTRWNLLFIRGCVPGAPGTVVHVTDARRRPLEAAPPFPTSAESQVPIGVHCAPPVAHDPGELPLP